MKLYKLKEVKKKKSNSCEQKNYNKILIREALRGIKNISNSWGLLGFLSKGRNS